MVETSKNLDWYCENANVETNKDKREEYGSSFGKDVSMVIGLAIHIDMVMVVDLVGFLRKKERR